MNNMPNSLKIWPDPSLSTVCTEVTNFSEISALLDSMLKVMEETKALGLAANQLGYSSQIMLVRTRLEIIEIINPKIISTSEEQYENEACLSFPGITTKIKRPLQIHFTCQDRNGINKEYLAYGLEALCFAHEHDHLLGKTILDHSNRHEKKRILKLLK
jgi:peptide deformylase